MKLSPLRYFYKTIVTRKYSHIVSLLSYTHACLYMCTTRYYRVVLGLCAILNGYNSFHIASILISLVSCDSSDMYILVIGPKFGLQFDFKLSLSISFSHIFVCSYRPQNFTCKSAIKVLLKRKKKKTPAFEKSQF